MGRYYTPRGGGSGWSLLAFFVGFGVAYTVSYIMLNGGL